MIAFFNNFSEPLISFLNSGIEENPSKAKSVIPNGRKNFDKSTYSKFEESTCGKSQMKINITMIIIPKTPQVSIFFNSLNNKQDKIIPLRLSLAKDGWHK